MKRANSVAGPFGTQKDERAGDVLNQVKISREGFFLHLRFPPVDIDQIIKLFRSDDSIDRKRGKLKSES